jgi:uncharacterized protein
MTLHRAAAVCALLLASLASGSSNPGNYAALPAHKALAVAVGDPSIVGTASGEPSDQRASVAALTSCIEQNEQAGFCELTRLNDADITTGSQIRARVAHSAHPLFLWRFHVGTSIAYLAGSIHVMKPSLFPLPAQFDAAFALSNRLAVEVNTNGLAPDALRAAFRNYALLPEGQSIGMVLRPATLASVNAHLQAQTATIASVATLKPAMLATQLAVARLSALGYLPEFGLEQHFMNGVGNRPVLELETLDEQLAVLTSPPMAVQDEMLAETIDQMDTIEPIIAAMIVAWLAGDEREFRRLFDLESGDSPEVQAFMRRLLEDRNVGMAEKIVGYLKAPGTTFVLVGAAHLTGPEGIVALLEARGLKGHRINSNDTI